MKQPKPLVRAKDNPEASPTIIVVGAHTSLSDIERIARDTAFKPPPMEIPLVGGRTFEENPRYNGPKKIHPTEMLITTGDGALPDQFYPYIVKQREIAIIGDKHQFEVLARMKVGFDTEDEALLFAARQMNSVPIWRNNRIEYPFFNVHSTKAMDAAQARRERKAQKLQEQQEKQRGKSDSVQASEGSGETQVIGDNDTRTEAKVPLILDPNKHLR